MIENLSRYFKELKEKYNLKEADCNKLSTIESEISSLKLCTNTLLQDNYKLKDNLKELKVIKQEIKSGNLSDGYHTFNDLYEQRMYLFACIVKQNIDKAWKSYKHEDGQLCFGGGWFIVGIDTPKGSYTYHYENKYWHLFDCKELEKAKHWDGHTDKDVDRLLFL